LSKDATRPHEHKGSASRKLHLQVLESRSMLSGTGLNAQYFHNDDFTGLAAERTEAVDFNWGSASPVAGVDPDTFSVRWTGQVEALYSETYTFYTTSNQGARLWVDGQMLVDNWEPHNTEEDSATIALVVGQKYDLRLEYFEQYGSAEIQLEWSSASQTRQIISAVQLYESPEGLRGEYSDAFGGSALRIDSAIDFDWGIGRSHPSIAVDQFDVQWTGQVRADFSEEYVFSIQSDEGARLWIGNELVIDDWTAHTTQVETGTKMLEVGKWYDLRLEYYDNTGHAEVELAWSSESQTGTGVFEVIPSSNLRAAKAATLQFTNSLGYGQDPFVIRWNDSYISVRSGGGSVWIDQADSLQDIHPTNPASATSIAWTAPSGTNYSEQIWAPEIHQLNDKWYIYVAASDGNNSNHRMHVLERDDPNPRGQYVYKGQINTTPDRWAIDGTVLSWQGQLYFIWSGWPGSSNGQQNLYIAEMSDPLTISSNRVLISSPQYAWEQFGLSINEGPQILTHEGELHIVYSGSSYWTHEYALGRLTYDGVGSLLDAASWQKDPNPVFQQAGNVVGTGHASFTTSQDETEHWIVYHAHHDKNNWQDDRDVYIQEFEFAADGTPDFGTPIPAGTPLSVPSGEVDPERPFVPSDFDASGDVGASDLDVWSEQYGTMVFPGISADSSANGQVDGVDFLAWQRDFVSAVVPDATVAYWRHEEGPSGGLIATGNDTLLDAAGNGNHMETFDPSFTSATYSSSVSPLQLRSGSPNTLSLDFGPGGDGAGQNDDNYSDSKPINSQLFSEMTVELAFSMNSIGGFQTLLGKDGKPNASPVAPLQMKVRGDDFPSGIDNQLFVEWIDGDGDNHFLSSGSTMTSGEWYHVAFTLSDTDASLYIADETGPYTLVDSISGTDFAGSSSEVLIDSTGDFSVGRGMYNGNVADWSDALIDEVRISDRVLAVTELLFDPAPAVSMALLANSGNSETEAAQSALLADDPIEASSLLAVASSSLATSAVPSDVIRSIPSTHSAVFVDEVFEHLYGLQTESSNQPVVERLLDVELPALSTHQGDGRSDHDYGERQYLDHAFHAMEMVFVDQLQQDEDKGTNLTVA
jgi:GH43 family beta-xylosidase